MELKQIKKQTNGKYKIILENQTIITYDEVILKHNLLFKKNINEDLIETVLKDNEYYEMYNKTIKYLTTKIRSQMEVEKFLEKYELNEDKKSNLINELIAKNLINDNKFIEAYINDKIYLSNSGPNKIKKELLIHIIDETLIDKELSKISNEIIEEKINKIIQKRIKINKKSNFIFRQHLTSYLVNLGYDYQMINKYLTNIKTDDSAIKKEINNQYRKLSKKYSNEDLVNNVRYKLYSKGYTKEEIDHALEEITF